MSTGVILRNLLTLVSHAAFGSPLSGLEPMSPFKWRRLVAVADVHEVLPLVVAALKRAPRHLVSNIPADFFSSISAAVLSQSERSERVRLVVRQLVPQLASMQVRPIAVGAIAAARLYPQPDLRILTRADFFLPFDTKAKKADEWALNNASDIEHPERDVLQYSCQGIIVRHYHRLGALTNPLLVHTMQQAAVDDLRESQPCFFLLATSTGQTDLFSIEGQRIEHLSPTMSLLEMITSVGCQLLRMKFSLVSIVDVGILLRSEGDKVDFVALQRHLRHLHLRPTAQYVGAMLKTFFSFGTDELQFLDDDDAARADKLSEEQLTEVIAINTQRPRAASATHSGAAGTLMTLPISRKALLSQLTTAVKAYHFYPYEGMTNMFASLSSQLQDVEE